MIKNKESKLFIKSQYLWLLALTIFFSVSMNYDWRDSGVFWYGSLLLVFTSYLLAYNGYIYKELSTFSKWYISFFCLCVVSLTWSISANTGMDVIKIMIVLLAVLFVIQSAISFDFSINTLLKCYFVGVLINTVYVLLTIDVAQLGDVQLGAYLLDGWNGNGIGFMTTQGALMGVYLFSQSKKKAVKIIYLLCSLALGAVTMYTGSRTAFIMLVAGLVIFFWLSYPTKIVRNIIITAVVLMGGFYLIMNVESFYKVLGSRFEGLFALFSGEGKVDSSSDIRNAFIENGKKWFLENPLIGYGINNYKELNIGATGRFTYAHNNFVEIAVDLGVVGLVWYFSAYVYLAFRLLKSIRKNLLNALLLALLLASLISQYGTVSYYNFYHNLLLMLCFYANSQRNLEKEHIEK